MGLKLLGMGGFDYSDEACASLVVTDVSPGGSGEATWGINLKQGDALPPRYCPILILSDSGISAWGGRIEEWSVTGWNGCDGKVNFKALGWATQLGDRAISQSTIYGPRPLPRVNQNDPSYVIVSLTAEGAIRDAMDYCQNVAYSAESGPEHLLLEETRDYLGSRPQDVVNDISAIFSNLATPYQYHVRPSGLITAVMRWKPRDLTARYSVRLEDGVSIDVRNTVTELFNEAVIPYSNDRSVVATSGSSLPGAGAQSILKSRVINLNGQVQGKSQALGIANGLVTQGVDSRAGWSYTITISQKAKIYQIGISGPIEKITVQAGSMIRIVGLNGSAFGPSYSVPSDHFISEARYTAKDDLLVLTCGMTPTQRGVAILRGAAESSGTLGPILQLWDKEGQPNKSTESYAIFGPRSEDVQATSSEVAASIIPGIPTIDNRMKQQRPETLPPLPPPLTYQINNPGETGDKGRMVVPPLQLQKWFIVADKAVTSTFTIQVKLRTSSEVLLTATLTPGQIEKVEQAFNPIKNLEKAWDMLMFDVTSEDATLEWVIIGFWAARYFPRMVGKPTNSAPIR